MNEKEVINKPFPNEHSCRLESPEKYIRFRRTNCAQKHDGKCIDVIYGITAADKSEIQALRYKKSIWAADSARSHCRGRGGSFEAAGKKEIEKEMKRRGLILENVEESEDKKMIEDKAEWTTAFINKLPDAAFAYIEPGGKKDEQGKTVPRRLRHFPHHNGSVKVGTDNKSVDLPHLRNALARAPQSPFGPKAISHLKRHASALGVGKPKAEDKSQYGFSVISKEDHRIIAGYASYIMIDSDDQLVTHEALTDGLKKFMSDRERRNIMFRHDGVQIGKVIEEFEGKETHVDDVGLYIVSEIYDDLETANEVWDGVLEGDYNAFSISFEPLEKAEHIMDGVWEEVLTINLLEVSVCQNPKNPLSRFEILSKSQNVEKIKKGEIMTEEELKLKKNAEKADLDKDTIVASIKDELNKLKLLGDKITAVDLSDLAGLVTNLRTDGEKSGDEKGFPFPEKAPRSKEDKNRWPIVIANAIDDLYSKLDTSEKSQKSSLDTVKKLKAEVIHKGEEADAAKKDAEVAKKGAAETKDVATKDREVLGEIQESLKGVNTTFEKFDERLKALENQKEVKTKVSKEKLVENYKPLNVRETNDGVEMIQEGD